MEVLLGLGRLIGLWKGDVMCLAGRKSSDVDTRNQRVAALSMAGSLLLGQREIEVEKGG